MDIWDVKAPTQANYPNLPINRAEFLPDPASLQENHSPMTRAHGACYPSGSGGYQANCHSNGPSYCCYQLAGNWVSHYGIDPYNGQGHYRYVYIVDEMEGTRASEWLAWLVNYLNTNWYPQNPSQKRPYFVYFGATWLRQQNPGYAAYHDCQGSLNQFIEFCKGTGQGASFAGWNYVDNMGKVGTGDATINAWTGVPYTPDDMYTEYSVLHEFGHLFALAHNQDCDSAMTYCGATVGQQYLYYNVSDTNALNSIYDGTYPD